MEDEKWHRPFVLSHASLSQRCCFVRGSPLLDWISSHRHTYEAPGAASPGASHLSSVILAVYMLNSGGCADSARRTKTVVWRSNERECNSCIVRRSLQSTCSSRGFYLRTMQVRVHVTSFTQYGDQVPGMGFRGSLLAQPSQSLHGEEIHERNLTKNHTERQCGELCAAEQLSQSAPLPTGKARLKSTQRPTPLYALSNLATICRTGIRSALQTEP